MTVVAADARPEKTLFLDMFIRDLSLEDSVLDLIDNSIDSFIRTNNIDINQVLLPENNEAKEKLNISNNIAPGLIEISFNTKHFAIKDNCGGITVESAKKDVFRIGHAIGLPTGQLGVYGIGMKRAIFKIGNHIVIESKTSIDGFLMDIDVPKWASNSDNWDLPMEITSKANNTEAAGISITIDRYRPEVLQKVESGVFEGRLKEMIAKTYSLFLKRYINITLNGNMIEPSPIPLGCSDQINIAKESFQEGNVQVIIYAGLASRDRDGEWRAADAGWYVACNGRLILVADKTELTWGEGLPSYQPKYRGFIGIVLFSSQNSLLLPWTTTKRGLNQESTILQRARTRMAAVGRPVLTFLDSMYSSQETTKQPQREAAESTQQTDIRNLTIAPHAYFKAAVKPPGEPSTKIQYDAKEKELARIRKALGKYSWSGAKIGRYTFEYFLKNECPE